jgi:hypothetical protein
LGTTNRAFTKPGWLIGANSRSNANLPREPFLWRPNGRVSYLPPQTASRGSCDEKCYLLADISAKQHSQCNAHLSVTPGSYWSFSSGAHGIFWVDVTPSTATHLSMPLRFMRLMTFHKAQTLISMLPATVDRALGRYRAKLQGAIRRCLKPCYGQEFECFLMLSLSRVAMKPRAELGAIVDLRRCVLCFI